MPVQYLHLRYSRFLPNPLQFRAAMLSDFPTRSWSLTVVAEELLYVILRNLFTTQTSLRTKLTHTSSPLLPFMSTVNSLVSRTGHKPRKDAVLLMFTYFVTWVCFSDKCLANELICYRRVIQVLRHLCVTRYETTCSQSSPTARR
jgi:hypothetical protein